MATSEEQARRATRLLALGNEMRKILSRVHRDNASILDFTTALLCNLYPKTTPLWSGTSPTTLEVMDLLVPKGEPTGDSALSPFDFACAFLDPASGVARLTKFKPPLDALLIELSMLGPSLMVEEDELPSLNGLCYADVLRVVLAGVISKKMLESPEVVVEYMRRRELVQG